ncbi:hypothetical protein B9J78_04420 [bacterium Unc6]|nr:hypothetical protein [bacterium Unc6]
MGEIIAVCLSVKKGTSKKDVKEGILKENYGLVGDAHAGPGLRQLSLLASESLEEIERKGLKIGCGGFGENLTTSGIELTSLVKGVRLKIGKSILIEITQIGKTCKRPCKIYKKLGNCILPSQGIFAKVLKGGRVRVKDRIKIENEAGILVAILIISDRCAIGERTDKSGEVIKDFLKRIGFLPARYRVVPDEREHISSALKDWSDEEELDLILTAGGTGFSPRDVTPEATKDILEKETPGLSEMIRTEGAKKTMCAYLSRGIAGIRKKTLIINLPGSPKGAGESLKAISPILCHAIDVMKGAVKDG